MSELLRATIALQEDSIQMQEKENERLTDSADKLVEVLDNTLTALISVCLHDETPYTRDVIGDANKALKEYKGNAT